MRGFAHSRGMIAITRLRMTLRWRWPTGEAGNRKLRSKRLVSSKVDYPRTNTTKSSVAGEPLDQRDDDLTGRLRLCGFQRPDRARPAHDFGGLAISEVGLGDDAKRQRIAREVPESIFTLKI